MKVKLSLVSPWFLVVAMASLHCGSNQTIIEYDDAGPGGNGGSNGGSGGTGNGGSGNGSSGSNGGSGGGSGSPSSGSGSSSGGGGPSSGSGSSSGGGGPSSGSGSSSGGNTSSSSGSGSGSGSGSSSGGTDGTCNTASGPVGVPSYVNIMNTSCSVAPGWTVPNDPYPYVGGDGMQPGYIPTGVIIPTLDDGPDTADPLPTDGSPPDGYNPGSATKTDLAFLNANNLHFDFFINTNNWTDPVTGDCATETDYEPHNDILLIAQTQNIGNHTVHHVLMAGEPPSSWYTPGSTMPLCCDCMYNSGVTCDSELKGVETVVNTITNGGRPHLTRMRPPYGGLWTLPSFTSGYSGDFADETMVTAKYAVTALWNIDDGDSNWDPSQGTPPPTGDTIVNNVMTAINGGGYGIVLQHAVFPWTADALPKLYGPGGMIPTSQLATIEDAFCWKYGKHSWELVGNGAMPN